MEPEREQMNEETLVISPSLTLSSRCDDLSIQNSPRTPKDDMFSPFASGPDTLLLAPFPKKCRTSTLLLGSSLECEVTDMCDTEMQDHIYADLLEAISTTQAEEISVSDDGCRTPTLETLVNDVAETCPNAPARTTAANINKGNVSSKKKLHFNTAGLGRKLEF